MTKQQFQKNTVNLIRSIMRLSNKTQVWNNKYDTGTRTVKCYRDRDGLNDLNLAAILTQTLHDLNINYQIKFTEPSEGPWNPGTGGIIVKLPGQA
jgi:hypothetical protein